ncbi:MAG: hypothetical protein WB676_03755 [Bryobacteraceae bacterium]
MTDQQKLLVKRILESRYFSNAATSGKILQYVCENTANSDRSLKEYEIALEVLHRPESFDPKFDPVVRVSMKSVRERLGAYFDNEGHRETIHLRIPKGSYRACFETRREIAAPSPEALQSALKRFWAPYLDGNQSNLLLHTDPLFFRDAQDTYVRNLYINDPVSGRRLMAERLNAPDGLEPCFHYLSAGEVYCMFSLLRLFHDLGIPLRIGNSRLSSWNEVGHSNLILIGSTRTNRFMDMLQEESDFVLDKHEIRNLSCRSGEQDVYRGCRYCEGKLSRFSEYALITRRPGANPRSAVTIIASNHGRAVEGGGNHLTLESNVNNLLTRMDLDRVDKLPDNFQILLRVDMIDLDDEVVNVEYVSHRAAANGEVAPVVAEQVRG